ncbi:MAG: hypothetical protein NT086_19690 [Proteobacteria bacterium]|nr:hypothetical protein [Pseudomonadota bacterium]
MRTATEIAKNTLINAKTLTRHSTQIKRIAGGISSELKQHRNGFTRQEIEILSKAEALLRALASTHTKAAELKMTEEDKLASTKEQCELAIKETFSALTSVEDRITLVAATFPIAIRNRYINTPDDLEFYTKEAQQRLLHKLTDLAMATDVNKATDHAWKKFIAQRPELIALHHLLIEKIKKLSPWLHINQQ